MIKIKTDKNTLQDFAKTLTIILFLLSAFWGYKGSASVAEYLFYAALIFSFISLFMPRSIKYLYIYWIKLANIISSIFTTILIFIMYFGFVTPYSLIIKLFKGDLLNKKIKPNAKSYWVERDKGLVNLDKYRRQF